MHLMRDGPTVFFFPRNESEIRIMRQLAAAAQPGDQLTFEGSARENRSNLFRVAFFIYELGSIQLILQGDGPTDKKIVTDLTKACLGQGAVMYLGPRLGDELAFQFQWPESSQNQTGLLELIRPSAN